MALNTDAIAVIVGVVVPSTVFLAVLCYVCLMRMRSAATMPNYSQVAHELDPEELEFKRSIEMLGDDDDMEDLFFRAHGSSSSGGGVGGGTPTRGVAGAYDRTSSSGDGDLETDAAFGEYSGLDGMNDESHGSISINPDDFSFDDEELSHLSILEKFRSNLMVITEGGGNAAVSPLHGADRPRDKDNGGGFEEEEGGMEGKEEHGRRGMGSETPDEIRP